MSIEFKIQRKHGASSNNLPSKRAKALFELIINKKKLK